MGGEGRNSAHKYIEIKSTVISSVEKYMKTWIVIIRQVGHVHIANPRIPFIAMIKLVQSFDYYKYTSTLFKEKQSKNENCSIRIKRSFI